MQLKCWQYLPLTGTLILSLVQGQIKQTLFETTSISALLLFSIFNDSISSTLRSLKVWVYRLSGVSLSIEFTAMQQIFFSQYWNLVVNLFRSRQGILNRIMFLPAFSLSLGTTKYYYLLPFLFELQSRGLRSWIGDFSSLIQKAPCIGHVREVLSGTSPLTSTGKLRSSCLSKNQKLKMLMYSKMEKVLKQLSTNIFRTWFMGSSARLRQELHSKSFPLLGFARHQCTNTWHLKHFKPASSFTEQRQVILFFSRLKLVI